MVYTKRLLAFFILSALCSPLAARIYAAPINFSGTFTNDDSTFSYSFTTTSSQNFTATTTSFANGGFIPVLTLFSASGGDPLAFAETDNSDVILSQLLGPGSYLLYLTEDPNVFTSTLAAGPLFAGSPTITGDICGVNGGKFLNTFTAPCSQRNGSYALTTNLTPAAAATPEPSTWLLLLPPAALAFAMRRRSFVY